MYKIATSQHIIRSILRFPYVQNSNISTYQTFNIKFYLKNAAYFDMMSTNNIYAHVNTLMC